MAFPIIPRVRSGASGYPTSLYVGELAVNTKDGELYLGADNGVVKLAVPGAAGTTATQFTGNGSATDFAPILGWTSTSAAAYLVSVGGIDQRAGLDYTIGSANGGTLQLATAPANGVPIQVRAITQGTGGGGSGNATQLQGVDVSGTAPTNGQVLAYNGTAWTPTTATSSAAGYGRTRFIGNGTQTQFTPIQGFNVANINRNNYLITINNVLQDTDVESPTFSFSTDNDGTLTFANPPGDNTLIVVRALGGYGNLEVPKVIPPPVVYWYEDISHSVTVTNQNVNQSTEGPFSGAKSANFLDQDPYQVLIVPIITGESVWTYEFFGRTNVSDTTLRLACYFTGYDTGIAIQENAWVLYQNGSTAPLNISADFVWHHFAMVCDGNVIAVYVDGQAVSAGTPIGLSTSYDLRIGSYNSSGNQFVGNISDARLSRVARYTSQFTPPTSLFSSDSDTMALLTMSAS